MKTARILIFTALFCSFSGLRVDAASGSRLHFIRRDYGVAITLDMHALGENVFPDHYLEASSDLSAWQEVGVVSGGIGIWPTTQEWSWNTNEQRQFFRVRERLNVSGADLNGIDLSGQNHRGANLPWAELRNANLVGTDFSEANLEDANLRDSFLSGANLRDADLCNADLRGANVSSNDLAHAALLNTWMPDGTFATDDLLAEALALDVSAELTAPVSIYLKMRRELAAIRAVVPDAFPVSPRFEWGIPNGLWVTVTPQQFDAINASDLGPINHFGNWADKIAFARHFHPRALAAILRRRFGVTEIEPFLFAGTGDYAIYNATESTYTLSRGFDDCPSGCLQRLTWVVKIGGDGKPIIIQAASNHAMFTAPVFPALNLLQLIPEVSESGETNSL